ncbi:MAG TPA: class I SAM-dependent methyltransferase [Steroidobacteraceae bacterium]|nr:class I SAM-dependent methyltransferase [Steroidobacteraceae bacterium]
MTDTVISYDQLPYAHYSFPDSHPRRLHALARLLGLETAAPAQCRVLELGCAVGGNIVPMAYSLPTAQLVGIDLVASQIESAKRFAAACGVTNLDLRAANIMEVTPQWGKFDYIITHGVFSWVPHEVAEKVLQICAEQLTPNGLAYISFNTYPGGHMRMWVREAMMFHADAFPDPMQKARAGREFILSLARTPLLAPLLKSELQHFESDPDSYIVHEYLEGTNHPFYFRDFAARIATHGLQYLGDAMQNGIVGAEDAPGFHDWLDANRRDLIRLEQYADFVRNRVFRRALICHGDLTLDRTQLLAHAEKMHVAAFLRQTAAPNGMTLFQHSRGGKRVVGAGPLHDALVTINRRFPQAIPLREVVAAAAVHHREPLLRELVKCWMNAMLELYVEPPPVLARTPGDKPRASLVARYLAAQNQDPINQRHGSITVDATQRRFIQLLDGTRTREQVAAELGLAKEAVDQLVQFVTNAALLED